MTTAGQRRDTRVVQTPTSDNAGRTSESDGIVEPADPDALDLTVTVTGNQAELNYNPIAGYDHTAQWSPDLQPGNWTDLPGGMHNNGLREAGRPRRKRCPPCCQIAWISWNYEWSRKNSFIHKPHKTKGKHCGRGDGR